MQTLPSSLHIGVIRGGISPEYDVSIRTGQNILNHLSETHKPIDIFISRDGKWHINGVERSADRILKNVDVVYNALHGAWGEDGGLQEILDHHGVPYTGSERLSSAISMNKFLTKERVIASGIKTPIHVLVRGRDSIVDRSIEIFNLIPHPLIVKPANGGSSIGFQKVESYKDLVSTLENILSKYDDALVEEYIPGREVTCGVIDNFRGEDIYVLPTIEIIPPRGKMFDYEAKYSGKTQEICPADFSENIKREIEEISALVHKDLALRHYSRSDFIVAPKRGVYFLEVNTLPGMTNESLFPKSLQAVGISMKEFLHHVLGLALER